MQSTMSAASSPVSKEQDRRILHDFELHVGDSLKAELHFFYGSSGNDVMSSISFVHSHNPAMTDNRNLSIFSISRICSLQG